MKKNFLILCACMIWVVDTHAQNFKLGLRLAPSLAYNSVDDKATDDKLYKADGVGLRYSAGVVADFFFADNYAFSSGLWFTTKRSGVKVERNDPVIGGTHHTVTNLQYLQLPVSLKLFTNEVADDIKLYFQVGSTLGIKIKEKLKDFHPKPVGNGEVIPIIKKPDSPSGYSNYELGLLVAAGAEMRMGENTTFFGGISFNRDLINTISKKGPFNYNEPGNVRNQMRNLNSLISLEAGLKF